MNNNEVLRELADVTTSTKPAEADPLDQVRELLFGDQAKSQSEQVDALQRRIAELESLLNHRIANLEQRLRQLDQQTAMAQSKAYEELSALLSDMAQRTRNGASAAQEPDASA